MSIFRILADFKFELYQKFEICRKDWFRSVCCGKPLLTGQVCVYMGPPLSSVWHTLPHLFPQLTIKYPTHSCWRSPICQFLFLLDYKLSQNTIFSLADMKYVQTDSLKTEHVSSSTIRSVRSRDSQNRHRKITEFASENSVRVVI
jgi:hypothetical protein